MIELSKNIDYQQLIEKIGITYQSAKTKIISAVIFLFVCAIFQNIKALRLRK